MIYEFNDQDGTRGRSFYYGVIHEGILYPYNSGQEKKLATFESLRYVKQGKWSNTDWRVTTNSAKLFVIMSPFNGWSDDMETCIKYVQEYQIETGSDAHKITYEDSKQILSHFYPKLWERLNSLEKMKSELI